MPGTQPTSAPPCTPEWPRIGIRPRRARPGSPRARPTLTSARMVSTPCACCVRPIDQTKMALGRSTSSRANRRMSSRVAPLCASSAVPVGGQRAPSRAAVEPRGRALDERRGRRASRSTQRAQHADEEREVAAGVDVEPVIGEPRAEERALDASTAPSSAPAPARGRCSRPRSARRGAWPRRDTWS